MSNTKKTRLGALQVAVSMTALTIAAGLSGAAHAQNYPTGSDHAPSIVNNDFLDPFAPPPTGVLDDGVNGIGQVVTDTQDGFIGVCTGTLINPRTVLFAAHCVNDIPAASYGAASGGRPISVGFEADNFPGLVEWFNNGNQTDTATSIYNVNQVWYDPRSLQDPFGLGFLEGDIALATLDTHAGGVPTWAMLFSPLTERTHAVVSGYGLFGIGTLGGIDLDFRRRAAENMLDTLGSLNDVDDFLFGANDGLAQSLYMTDFDDPTLAPYDPFNGFFDFDLFDGDALPFESTTAPGNSGGPLIVDEAFDRAVVVGALSGGSTYHLSLGQPRNSYGTSSFYQPLFLFWDAIVQNNSYAYAGARHGNANWMSASHWVQLMDPNYLVVRPNGDLANALPNTPALGVSGDTTKFGEICFDDRVFPQDCVTIDQSGPGETSTGPGLVLPGGPGSTVFVPNNVDPNPAAGIRARYYDVTLANFGETYLKNTVTIDRLTVDGYLTGLDVRAQGRLNVLGDVNLYRGFINVDGRLNGGESVLVEALLTGNGTFNPTFLTSVDGTIAPGGLTRVGTLTIQGDVVLASGNELLIELGRTAGDQLRVTADAADGTAGNIVLGGDLWLTPAATGAAPRYGNTYTIVRAEGSRIDTFDDVNGFLGVLRPKVTYTATGVNVKLEAGSFLDLILHNPALMPFALALDELREDHYAALYNLYGEIDLMDANRLSAALSSMAPGSLMDAHGIMAMQGSAFGDTLQQRLSSLTQSGQPMGLSVMGAPEQILAFNGDDGFASATMLSLSSELAETRNIALPGGMSAFISGGYGESRKSTASGRTSNSADDGLRTWNIFGGVEQSFGNATFGVAGGYSRGSSFQSGTSALAESDVAQTAAYGVYRFDNDVYVKGLVGYGSSRTSTERTFAAGQLAYEMQGETHGQIFLASVEAGMNFDVSDNLMVTPNVSLRQQSMRLEGLTETGGETALQVSEQSFDQLEARFGARLSGEYRLASGWTLSPSLDAAAVANLTGDEGGVWARFAAAPDVPFYLPGAARDDLWGEVTGGLSFARDDTTFSLHMESSVERDELHEDRYMARYAQKF